jgi:DNA-binding transcriptional MerR regulator
MVVTAMEEHPVNQGFLRIGEVARRAGVARATVSYYVREGLLPQPLKTHRNQAYYDPDCVQRIKAIKELQERTRLPLNRIKELVGDSSGTEALAKSIMQAQEAMLDAVTPAARDAELSVEDAAAGFNLTPAFVRSLVDLGIVTLQGDGFRGPDVEVLATLGKLNATGFNDENGFVAEDLLIYRDALRNLLQAEVEQFMRIITTRGTKLTPELARGAVDGATLLLHALRKKIVADYLAAAVSEIPAGVLKSIED